MSCVFWGKSHLVALSFLISKIRIPFPPAAEAHGKHQMREWVCKVWCKCKDVHSKLLLVFCLFRAVDSLTLSLMMRHEGNAVGF